MILFDDTRALKMVAGGVIACMALLLFVATVVQAFFISPDSKEAEMTDEAKLVGAIVVATSTLDNNEILQSPEQVQAGELPSRILVPSLGIDAKVQKVGVTSAGNMANPTNFTDVGWYKNGVVPGHPGSAVMAGHVDNGLSLPGVFKKLHTVTPGGDVYVVTESGKELKFVVTDVSSYEYRSAPADEIFSKDGRPVLRLITCAGRWLGAERTYDQRIVVTAELASR